MVIGLQFYSPDITQSAILQDINVSTSAKTTLVDLHLDETIHYSEHTLPARGLSSKRCYIDLYNTRQSNSLPSLQSMDNQQISRIRIGSHTSKLRVVFDLKDNYECTALPLTDHFIIRITIFDKTKLLDQQSESIEPDTKTTDISNKTLHAFASSPATQEIENRNSPLTILPPTSALDSDIYGLSENNEPTFWGWLQLYGAKDTQSDLAEDNSFARSRIRLGTDWAGESLPQMPLRFKGSIDFDRIFYDSARADENNNLTLHETYIQISGSSWDLSLGKQRVRWGKSDQLSPVDSINPQDLRQSIAVDLEDRVLPSWLLRTKWYEDVFTLETIIQPWFQKSEIDYFDSDWALYRNLRQSIMANPAVPQFLKNYANSLYVDEHKPSHTLENMSGGIRLTLQTDQSDFGLSYHYGWETLPTISKLPISGVNYNGAPNTDASLMLASISPMPPTSNRIEATYKRQLIFGIEWETTILDPFGFRGEIAYIDKVAFLSSDLTSSRTPITHLVTGIDYTSESEWYFNVQGSWQHLHNYSKNILYFKKDNVSTLGEISKPVWRGNIELGIGYSYMLTDKSSYFQPNIILQYFRNIECELGAMVYTGDNDSTLGSYDHTDQVYAKIEFSF